SEELGGAHIHNAKSGNAHMKAKSEEEALDKVRELLTYLQENNEEKTPFNKVEEADDMRPDLTDFVPYDATRPYDVKNVIKQIVDPDSFCGIHADFANTTVVRVARLQAQTVGLLCGQPKYLAGGLDIDSSDKAARFIRFCDSFNISLIT